MRQAALLLLLSALAALAGGATLADAAVPPAISANDPDYLLERDLGVTVPGEAFTDTGSAVANAGDVNGDGHDDYVIGADGSKVGSNVRAGSAYVIYGGVDNGRSPLDVDLASLTPRKGYRIDGSLTNQLFGHSVANAGDVNGDGVPDQLIGSPGAGTLNITSGAAYVVYGRRQGRLDPPVSGGAVRTVQSGSIPGGIQFNSDAGYAIEGDNDGSPFAFTGWSVANAGDVNGDQIPDQIVGAPRHYSLLDTDVTPGATSELGLTWVVFGRRSGRPLAPPSGSSNSVELDLIAHSYNSGPSAIHFNNGIQFDGYVVRGFGSGTPARGTLLGGSVTNAGDINGDGHNDQLIGAAGLSENAQGGQSAKNRNGGYFVIYGRTATFRHNLVNLDTVEAGIAGIPISPSVGYQIDGEASYDTFAGDPSVVNVGDLNGDHVPDAMLGAPSASPEGKTGGGTAWVVYGRRNGTALTPPATTGTSANDLDLDGTGGSRNFDASGGYRIDGEAATSDGLATGIGNGLSTVADLNGDGQRDFLIGGASKGVENDNLGRAYVVFARGPATRLAAPGGSHRIDLDGNASGGGLGFSSGDGFRISGPAAFSLFGNSIADAGDQNGDGYSELLVGAPWMRHRGSAEVQGAAYVISLPPPPLCPGSTQRISAGPCPTAEKKTPTKPTNTEVKCVRLATAKVTQNVSKWAKFGRAARARIRGPKAGFFIASTNRPAVFSVLKFGVAIRDAHFTIDGKAAGKSTGARPRLTVRPGKLAPGVHKIVATIRPAKTTKNSKKLLKQVTAKLRFRVLACPPAKMTIRMSRRKLGSGFDLRAGVESGGPELSHFSIALPFSVSSNALGGRRVSGRTIGRIALVGKNSRRVDLKAPRKASGSRIALAAAGARVTLTSGAKPRIEVSKIPAGVHGVQLILRGRRNGLFTNRRVGKLHYVATVRDRSTPPTTVKLANDQRVYRKG